MLKNKIVFVIMITSLVACGNQSTLMKGSWQPNEHYSSHPVANHLLGKWLAKDMPFTLTLEPRSDSEGSIAFSYKDYSVIDDNCLLTAASESVTLRFFADNLRGSGTIPEPALEITGTVHGDSLRAQIAFKYEKETVTSVWNTTLYRAN